MLLSIRTTISFEEMHHEQVLPDTSQRRIRTRSAQYRACLLFRRGIERLRLQLLDLIQCNRCVGRSCQSAGDFRRFRKLHGGNPGERTDRHYECGPEHQFRLFHRQQLRLHPQPFAAGSEQQFRNRSDRRQRRGRHLDPGQCFTGPLADGDGFRRAVVHE